MLVFALTLLPLAAALATWIAWLQQGHAQSSAHVRRQGSYHSGRWHPVLHGADSLTVAQMIHAQEMRFKRLTPATVGDAISSGRKVPIVAEDGGRYEHVLQVMRNDSAAHPCAPAASRSSAAACRLDGNVVATRRQLRDCGFEAVVVVPLATVQSPQIKDKEERARLHTLDYAHLPFPVVTCVIVDGLPDDPVSFMTASGLDAPPCVRPSIGRDDVAYTSFILQNYGHLPPHMFFVHGHEDSWHQDRSISELLTEFCGRKLSRSMYVSLNNNLSRDWRSIFCITGMCTSADKARALDYAWSKYLGYYLGALPPDITHFCCSQFVVSRDRVLRHPHQLYANMLSFSLDGFPGIYEAMPCYGRCELPGQVLEVLWAHIFGESVPLRHDERLGITYPTEADLASEVMQAHRYAWSTDEWLREPLT